MSEPVETQVYWRDPRVHERIDEIERAVAKQNKQKDKGKGPMVTELPPQANVQKKRGSGITIREPTPMQEDSVTPHGDKLGRGHREKKPAITLHSPFIGRMVNVNEKISRDEDNVCDWIYTIRGTGSELYFAWRDVKVMRSEFESFSDGYHIKPFVVDAWSVVLNHRENLRSPQSPLRFYCTTVISSKCLLRRGKSTVQMDNEFNRNIDIDLRRFSHVKLLEIDMMFIPVLIEKHYYLIVFDLKTPCMELLDNNASSTSFARYNLWLETLWKSMVNFLKSRKHPKADLMLAVKPRVVLCPWKTKENLVDSGIYCMRHMEVYVGSWGESKWKEKLARDTTVKAENQLERLRAKYLFNIIMFEKNMVIMKVKEDCIAYSSKTLEEKNKFTEDEYALHRKRLEDALKDKTD
uniref:Ubiquitin-like protease family profile domain-containing protein n=1 Tax=Kalanchoe fedtschenkoi TaxID=63787 RepID=A0A7N1A6Q0_KALFE